MYGKIQYQSGKKVQREEGEGERDEDRRAVEEEDDYEDDWFLTEPNLNIEHQEYDGHGSIYGEIKHDGSKIGS